MDINLTIRKADLKDVQLLGQLNKHLWEDEGQELEMSVAEMIERMKLFLETDYTAYIFDDDETVIGYALFNIKRTPLYLRHFFIVREQRKKGYGTVAFNVLQSEIMFNEIDIDVLSLNKIAIKFWQSLGFKERSIHMRLII